MPGPISVPVTTRVSQLWSGRQASASGVNTLLLMNTDLVNTVKVGSDLTSVVVPIPPNGSLSVDPSVNWYVQGTVAGTAPLVVIPNGQGNFLGLTAGMGNLAIPSIQSPNFNTANPLASPSPSWGILKNGIAYFFGLFLTGGTFTGPDYIVDPTGIYLYSGTPAVGNLTGSWVPLATTVTDPKGNTVQHDLTVYIGNGGYVNVNSNGGIGGNTAVLLHPGNTSHVAVNPQVYGGSQNSGLVNEEENLVLTSGNSGHDDMQLQLISATADNTVGAVLNFLMGGTVLSQLFKTVWNIGVPISCTLGTPSNPSIITNGAYTRIASPFSNGWVSGGGGTDANGIIYRMLNNGSYEVWLDIINPGAQVNSVITNLPAPFRPQKNFKHEIAGSLANCVWIQQNTNGDLIAVGNTLANQEINGRCVFPTLAIP
jgi:hypothetical protein